MGPVNLFIKRKQVSYRTVSPIELNAYGGRLLFTMLLKSDLFIFEQITLYSAKYVEPTAIVGSERYSSESPRWTLKQEAQSLPLAAEEQRAVRSFYIDWRRIMSLMRLYSLTASDLEDWASSGTHLPNELTQAGTDSKLICILTKAQSGLRMVSSGTACPQLLRQMIPAGHSSKQPPTRDRCCFFQEVHNELTKVWHASTLLILPPSPLLMALKKKGYGKLSI